MNVYQPGIKARICELVFCSLGSFPTVYELMEYFPDNDIEAQEVLAILCLDEHITLGQEGHVYPATILAPEEKRTFDGHLAVIWCFYNQGKRKRYEMEMASRIVRNPN